MYGRMGGREVGRMALARGAVMVSLSTQSIFHYVSLGFRFSVWCYFCLFVIFHLFWCVLLFSFILVFGVQIWLLCFSYFEHGHAPFGFFSVCFYFTFFHLNGWEIRKRSNSQAEAVFGGALGVLLNFNSVSANNYIYIYVYFASVYVLILNLLLLSIYIYSI